MPEYMIAGVPVNFPFEPYDVQKAYMEKVITYLREVIAPAGKDTPRKGQ